MSQRLDVMKDPLEIDCPICDRPMKVNESFQVAFCDVNNGCGFWMNWSNVFHRSATMLRWSMMMQGKDIHTVTRIMNMLCSGVP